MVKIWRSPASAAPLLFLSPEIVSAPAPGPVIVRLSATAAGLIPRAPAASVRRIVPERPSSLITSLPDAALAAATASRSVGQLVPAQGATGPSLVVVTV